MVMGGLICCYNKFILVTIFVLELQIMLEKAIPLQAIRYLNQVLGEGAAHMAASGSPAQLPYYLHDTYELMPGHLLGDPVTFACVKGDQPLAVQQVAQHMQ